MQVINAAQEEENVSNFTFVTLLNFFFLLSVFFVPQLTHVLSSNDDVILEFLVNPQLLLFLFRHEITCEYQKDTCIVWPDGPRGIESIHLSWLNGIFDEIILRNY